MTNSEGEDVVTVAYFEDSDSVDRSKRLLAGITKTASEAFGVEVTDDDIDDLVRTSRQLPLLVEQYESDARERRRSVHEPLEPQRRCSSSATDAERVRLGHRRIDPIVSYRARRGQDTLEEATHSSSSASETGDGHQTPGKRRRV